MASLKFDYESLMRVREKNGYMQSYCNYNGKYIYVCDFKESVKFARTLKGRKNMLLIYDKGNQLIDIDDDCWTIGYVDLNGAIKKTAVDNGKDAYFKRKDEEDKRLWGATHPSGMNCSGNDFAVADPVIMAGGITDYVQFDLNAFLKKQNKMLDKVLKSIGDIGDLV